MALFALPFAAVGVLSGYSAVRHTVEWLDARHWTPVAARVVDAQLQTHTSDDSTTYSVEASYRYEVAGVEYTGDRVWLDDDPDNLGDFQTDAHTALRRHLATGEPWTAFVDPEAPSEALLFRDLRPELLLFRSVFFFLFGGVGFGLLAAIPYVTRRLEEDRRYRERHPDEPWLWREEWRGRTIRSSAAHSALLPVAFAVFWNLISWPLLLVAGEEIFDPERRIALLALLFPVAGIGLALWALRSLLVQRRFGDSELELATVPVPAGGRLEGTVLCAARLARDVSPQLLLTCHEQTDSGDESDDRLTWQDEAAVDPSTISFDGLRTRIPIALDLPADARESVDGRVRWVLAVSAAQPGVDYSATFEVPVFGRALDPPRVRESRDDSFAQQHGQYGRGVEVTIEPAGGHRYLFRRARRRATAVGVTLFASIWAAIVVTLHRVEAPVFLRLAFGVTLLLVLLGAIDLWLTQRLVIAGPDGLSFRSGLFALGRRRTARPRDIERLRIASGMRAGHRLYYRILLKRAGERNERTIASMLDNRSAAQALVEQMRRDLGLADELA